MNQEWQKKIVRMAMAEDMPEGDITTDNLDLHDKIGRARLIAKEDLVLSGCEMLKLTFEELDSLVQIQWQFKDGDFVFKNQTIAMLQGSLAPMLKAERVALNFLGRLSGIATLTRCFADQVKHTKTKILDTRKTTAGLRPLEKLAVVHGGGQNHRFSLSDAILIKENHIRAAGGVQKSVQIMRKKIKKPIEIEVRSLAETREAVAAGVDRLLLDNMTDDELREALKIIPGSMATEASGNMNLDRVARVAELGVQYISVGMLTHSAPCADVSLLFE